MKYELTNREYEVMQILWANSKPMLASEIVEKSKNISNTTVFQVINQLLNKHYIKIAGQIVVIKSVSRVYSPTVTYQEYYSSLLVKLIRNTNDSASFKATLMHYAKKDKQNREKLVAEIKEFLADYEQQSHR